jgi:phosphatidylserine/phosphatidylglycerophosphate/cardiolipin synthase-like enzyme
VIDLHTLEPGRQTALEVAERAAAFLGGARRSLDLALYDVRLPGEAGDIVADALRDAARRGVAVRVAYNADHDERVFPPPPRTRPELLERLPFPTLGIPGIPDLMHHKYVVRDGEAVWTGSANWTTDSWTVQENVLIVTRSAEVAGEFGRNFEELWKLRDVDKTGRGGVRPLEVGGREARAWFTPGRGDELSHRIANALAAARRRIRIASPVITAGPILGTLAELAAEARVDVRGVLDRTQMEQVVYQWRTNGRSAWKIPILGSVLQHAEFKGKPSTRWTPESIHDFMHAKVTVADDHVFAGSFNLSRSGEQNAENVLELHHPELADRLAAFVDGIRDRYDRMPPPAATPAGGPPPAATPAGAPPPDAGRAGAPPPGATPAGAPSPDARPAGAPGGEPQTGGSPAPPRGRR